MRRVAIAFVALGVVAAVGAAASGDADHVTCHKVAAPDGSDAAAGTYEAPYATVERLAGALGPGQTGCLRGGRDGGSETRLTERGAARAPKTLRNHPGRCRRSVRGCGSTRTPTTSSSRGCASARGRPASRPTSRASLSSPPT